MTHAELSWARAACHRTNRALKANRNPERWEVLESDHREAIARRRAVEVRIREASQQGTTGAPRSQMHDVCQVVSRKIA